MSNEKWKQTIVEGYSVSTLGRVRNDKTEKILKPFMNENGYYSVILMDKGKKKHCRINRLVAMAFVHNPDPKHKKVVDHIDEDRSNNDVSNLQWITQSENLKKSGLVGRRGKYRKPVKCVETGEVYTDMHAADTQTGVCRIRISHCCRGIAQTAGGYHWVFYNEDDK